MIGGWHKGPQTVVGPLRCRVCRVCTGVSQPVNTVVILAGRVAHVNLKLSRKRGPLLFPTFKMKIKTLKRVSPLPKDEKRFKRTEQRAYYMVVRSLKVIG